MSRPINLSVVIPAFDEERRFPPFLDEISAHLAARDDVEVLVVDDGSTDATAAIVEERASVVSWLRLLRLDENRGKGAAVRAGLAAASGSYRVFLDADGSTPIGEVDRLLAAAEGDPTRVVVGSIGVPGAQVVQTQAWYRITAGRLGNLLIRALAVPGIRDTQRGCKLLSAQACEELLPLLELHGWAFDVELLAIARAAGYELVEVPVRWHHVEGTKVRAGGYLEVLRDVVAVRRRVRTLRPDLANGVRVGARP